MLDVLQACRIEQVANDRRDVLAIDDDEAVLIVRVLRLFADDDFVIIVCINGKGRLGAHRYGLSVCQSKSSGALLM